VFAPGIAEPDDEQVERGIAAAPEEAQGLAFDGAGVARGVGAGLLG
jgi:hypothetical protein